MHGICPCEGVEAMHGHNVKHVVVINMKMEESNHVAWVCDIACDDIDALSKALCGTGSMRFIGVGRVGSACCSVHKLIRYFVGGGACFDAFGLGYVLGAVCVR